MAKSRDDSKIKNWYLENFREFENKLNGESETRFHELRKSALAQFEGMNFPTLKDEEWKYTNVAPILKHEFIPSANIESEIPSDINSFFVTELDSYKLVFINGILNDDVSEYSDLPEGVDIVNLRSVINDDSSTVNNDIKDNILLNNSFDALNASYASDGFVIRLADNVEVSKPIQVLFLNGSSREKVLATPLNFLIAGENSRVSIIADFRGRNGKEYLLNSVTNIKAAPNAVVDYYKIQNEDDNSFHIERTEIVMARSSNVTHHNLSFGGSIVRNDINSKLEDEHCECNYNGLYLGHEDQHVDNHTFVDHAMPNCNSNELYKGILDDNSHGVFNGKIMVRKDAQKTNAYQSNKTILMSKSATIDTKPQLEIYADDVKCSHGATIGHLDDTAHFYITSRGIPSEIAKSMLLRAFVADVIEKIKIDELREVINHKIFEHLHRVEI
jgi:Fe-S cluster assembly protein SufD